MIYADIILFDSVGTPYTGNTLNISGMGGSEFQSILLLEQFANIGKKVICLNNTTKESIHNNVLYINNSQVNNYEFRCNHLILHRNSIIPKILHKNCYNWVTDNISYHNLPYFDICDQKKCTVITLSEFSNNQFPHDWEKKVIPFMIPEWVYNYTLPRVKQDFIYASSLMKGYVSTLEYWKYVKSKRVIQNKRLRVCLPGYDNPSRDNISNQSYDIDYLGTLKFEDVVDKISKSESLFYVNTMPETFCITAVLAEILKTNTNILCLNGVGALTEVLNNHNVTTNTKHFINGLNKKTTGSANDYRPSTIMRLWRQLFKC